MEYINIGNGIFSVQDVREKPPQIITI